MAEKNDGELDLNAIIADDQALDNAAFKRKTGDAAVDALIDAAVDIDNEPMTPTKNPKNRKK